MIGNGHPTPTQPLSKEAVDELTTFSADTMRRVGVPEQYIGIPEFAGGKAFDPHSGDFGGNIAGRGINLDAGILESIPRWEAWNNSGMTTRAETVIGHEWTELGAPHLAENPMFPGEDPRHLFAVQHAPETSLNISQGARDLLVDMRVQKFGPTK